MQTSIVERIAALRDWLNRSKLDAIIIPHEDEFLGEYLPPHNERLRWITGFTGSAGMAVISKEKAAIFVDGRYTVQVRKQVPSEIFQYCHIIEEPFSNWIDTNLSTKSKIAIDSRLHSITNFKNISQKLENNYSLIALATNPIEQLWQNRPAPVLSQARLMSTDLVEKDSKKKRNELAEKLVKDNVNAALICQLDSICWLLNIRGGDIPYLPVVLSCGILKNNGEVQFFIDKNRLPENFIEHVGAGVAIFSPESLEEELKALAGKNILVDPNTTNAWMSQILTQNGAKLIEGEDICLYAKASKNLTEIAGMKACHIKDGVAVSRFLAWLDREIEQGNLYDEGELSDKLFTFRQQDPSLIDLSFPSISAAGGNAAMCHYKHTDQPAPAKLAVKNVYLIDSGGQYPEGTTDITRTVAIGECSEEIKQVFTLVLKGHIALACSRFPKGTCGHQLDTLARQYLWAYGYDYDHGTGHGVGHCLSVHEGPQRISKVATNVPLLEGMILSNEPGFYKTDDFGIRIENLELVVNVKTQGEKETLGFEALTRAPIDKRLLDVSLLTEQEINWWNNYHKKVWQELSPYIQGEDLEWLKQATSAL